ncbi:hypothetical protein [Bacteroides sp. 224]|uniref:hypothetical protein n=1 Tax=Bacteroides sp. 224 TaxID=2302936 RepID=UPI0013D86275|nr:hypothetical protein [Bacteroides sp. 224]NDV65397.1 hypothetical protein [Bacteroides sp. 224]
MKMKLFLAAAAVMFSMTVVTSCGNKKAAEKEAPVMEEPVTKAAVECDSTKTCCANDSLACDSTKTEVKEEVAAE